MKGDVKISGVGIHSGLLANITVRPTKSGGIVFVRNGVKIPARYDNVTNSMLRNTTIGRAPNHVQTIEHLMAALFICNIRNAEIIMDNAETPILDGSAAEFIKTLSSLKTKDQIVFLRVKKEVVARAGEVKFPFLARFVNFIKRRKPDGFVKLSPTDKKRLDITARIIYSIPVIGDQEYSFAFDYDDFKKSAAKFMKDVAKSRTFGTIGEWEWLKKHGMGRGANGTNVIAINEAGDDTINDIYNKNGAMKQQVIDRFGHLLPPGFEIVKRHFKDEFVRHKIIDAVGDLYTSGYCIIGKLESFKGSHAMNNLVLKKLFSDPSNYDIIKS